MGLSIFRERERKKGRGREESPFLFPIRRNRPLSLLSLRSFSVRREREREIALDERATNPRGQRRQSVTRRMRTDSSLDTPRWNALRRVPHFAKRLFSSSRFIAWEVSERSFKVVRIRTNVARRRDAFLLTGSPLVSHPSLASKLGISFVSKDRPRFVTLSLPPPPPPSPLPPPSPFSLLSPHFFHSTVVICSPRKYLRSFAITGVVG